MTDAIQSPSLNALANKDFAQLQSTINNYENHKTSAADTQQAFQQEYLQINKDGVNNLIGQKFVDATYQKTNVPGLPSLTIQGNNDSKISLYNKDDNSPDGRQVWYDQKTGSLTAYFNNYSQQANANDQIIKKYIDPIKSTANNYFDGSLSAENADALLLKEVNDAAQAGYKIGNKDFQGLLAAAQETDLHFTLLDNGALGISSSDSQSVQKRIVIDPIRQTAKAEDLHLTAKNVAAGVGKFTLFGAAVGAATTGPAALIGGGIGAGVGAGVGAIEGSILTYELDQTLEKNPSLIFKM